MDNYDEKQDYLVVVDHILSNMVLFWHSTDRFTILLASDKSLTISYTISKIDSNYEIVKIYINFYVSVYPYVINRFLNFANTLVVQNTDILVPLTSALLNLPKGKSLGRSKPATNS